MPCTAAIEGPGVREIMHKKREKTPCEPNVIKTTPFFRDLDSGGGEGRVIIPLLKKSEEKKNVYGNINFEQKPHPNGLFFMPTFLGLWCWASNSLLVVCPCVSQRKKKKVQRSLGTCAAGYVILANGVKLRALAYGGRVSQFEMDASSKGTTRQSTRNGLLLVWR